MFGSGQVMTWTWREQMQWKEDTTAGSGMCTGRSAYRIRTTAVVNRLQHSVLCFTKWHVPPSRTSAEACLTGWPNAQVQHSEPVNNCCSLCWWCQSWTGDRPASSCSAIFLLRNVIMHHKRQNCQNCHFTNVHIVSVQSLVNFSFSNFQYCDLEWLWITLNGHKR